MVRRSLPISHPSQRREENPRRERPHENEFSRESEDSNFEDWEFPKKTPGNSDEDFFRPLKIMDERPPYHGFQK